MTAVHTQSIEFQLLCLSIRLDDPEGARQAAQSLLDTHVIDWKALWEQATWHRVRPQLAALLNALPNASVPESFMERLNAVRRQNAARQMANAHLFLRLSRTLNPLPVVPFKGFWMANSCYPRLEDRESEDLDLFIHPEHLAPVKAAMIGQGFHPMQGYPPWDDQRILATFGEYNFDQFQDGVRTYHVEYHGTLGAEIQHLDIRLADLAHRLREETFSGQHIQVFDPSALLVLTALHHGGKDAWEELRQVLDIGLMLHHHGDQLDWPWIQQMIRKYDAGAVYFTGMALAARLTGVMLPEAISTSAGTTRIERLADKRVEMLGKPPVYWSSFRVYGHRWLYHLYTKSSLWNKVRWTVDYVMEALVWGPLRRQDHSAFWLTRWLGMFNHLVRRLLRIIHMELTRSRSS